MSKLASIKLKTAAVEPVDAAERRRALEPNLSFLVQAPAGSGKTGLLVQRILRLLSVVERPESIVAVTFTIKASAEMRERVVRALTDAASTLLATGTFASETIQLARSALARDRELGWHLIDDPGRLHIQTIDALCANLVRQMPLVSDAGGVGSVAEDADPLYRQAARRALHRLAESSPTGNDSEGRALLRRLALHFDNNVSALESQIIAMLGKRDQWHSSAAAGREGMVSDFSLILQIAEAELRDVFRQHNTVDFIAITRAAIKALGDREAPSDLLFALDYRIEHLLIDEFQDTSRAQYELISALTGQWSDGDGRTIFLVGDPLQSIYGFRAAEVSLFQQCWQDKRLDAVRLEPLRLQTNFRSTPQIVDWVQTELKPVLNEDNRETGAVALQDAVAARPSGGSAPELIPLLNDRGSQEAAEVVRLLQTHKTPGEVAILVRSRGHVSLILKALRMAGIRYRAVEIDPLGEQQHVLDLLALTRAITHLADRAAWLACLRAPWCGLTLADLSSLAEGEPNRTILDLLSDPLSIPKLTLDGRTRAVLVQRVFAAAIERVGREALRPLLQQTWYALGGPAILSQRNQIRDTDTYFALIEELERGGIIHDFGNLTERCAELYAQPDAAADCVQVMTIHEAKGLEFDTVILPRLAGTPSQRDNDLLVWNQTLGGDLEIAAQPPSRVEDPEYKRICDLKKAKETNESKRLFYVACTRAKNQLYLIGSVKENSKGTDVNKANKYSFLGMIWDRSKPRFLPLLQRNNQPQQADLFASLKEARTIGRLPATWQLPEFDRSVLTEATPDRSTASERRVSYEWVGGASRHVGTVVHGVLNRIAQDGVAAWSEARINGLQKSVSAELARAGLTKQEVGEATEQALRALRTTLASERGRWILQPRAGTRAEWPITGLVGERLVSGTIDRLFRDQEGRLWIIDYKTSTHSGSQTAEFLRREQRRYRDQMESYGHLLKSLEGGPISFGLYFPLLDGWQEWEFADAAISAV